MIILMLIMWTLSILFMFIIHPISLGGILLLQTISISLMTGFMMFNFWYSYMLFLIMVGGMLVLFLYMTNVASNEKFKFSMHLSFIFITMFISMLMFIYLFDLMKLNINNLNNLTLLFNKEINLNLSMNKYFNSDYMIYLMLIIYLFITLIAIVKITNIKYGPLRPLS